MKYFPIDESGYFETASTEINYLPNDNMNYIEWITKSQSNYDSYLRQDISLLYENGKFKGIQNKWRQHTADIMLKQSYQQTKTSILQSISFHHAEIHYKDDTIKSIQKMSGDSLYFINEPRIHKAFHTPTSHKEKEWANKINKITDHHLQHYWNAIIEHYDIQKNNYEIIPLTDIKQFNEFPIPGLSMSETKQIIGQLWEGIYTNYITLLMEKQNQKVHSIPLIMMAKDNSHLLVLFQINDEKYKLIQKYPS